MSKLFDSDAGRMTASLLQAVEEARAAQATLEAAAVEKGPEKPSLETIRERLALLADLRDRAMAIVRALDARLRAAMAAAGPGVPVPALVEAAGAFAKLSRSIRLIILLEMRIEEALRGGAEGRPARRPAGPAAAPGEGPAPSADEVGEALTEAPCADRAEPAADSEPAESLVETEAAPAPGAALRDLGSFSNADLTAFGRERRFADRRYADVLTQPLDQLVPGLLRDLGFTGAVRQAASAAASLALAPPAPPSSCLTDLLGRPGGQAPVRHPPAAAIKDDKRGRPAIRAGPRKR